jgi:hypothetical protein
VYLTWLIDTHGLRVPAGAAAAAFSRGEPAAVLRSHQWHFLPAAGLPTLAAAVEYLLAGERTWGQGKCVAS